MRDPTAAPRCAWEEADALHEEWTIGPLPPLSPTFDPPGDYVHCGHGREPRFVFDGEVFIVTYLELWCNEEVEGENIGYWVIGTYTPGSWQTVYTLIDRGRVENVDMSADGTVRVTTSQQVLERNDGEWTIRTTNTPAWVLSDPGSGPAHVLIVYSESVYGRLDGDLMDFEIQLECSDPPPSVPGRDLSSVDFEMSPTGVPHVAQIGRNFADDIALFWSYPSGGVWVYEQIECLVDDLGRISQAPDLEFDSQGTAYVCADVHWGAESKKHIVFDNSDGTWRSEVIADDLHEYDRCSLEVDSSGRVHVLTNTEYRVREAGVWTTVLNFDVDLYGSLHVTSEGHVFILREGLVLLTNASGQWVEHQLGVDGAP